MRRSLNSKGVIGRTTSSFSGKEHSGGNGGGFFRGLKYWSRGSFSMRVTDYGENDPKAVALEDLRIWGGF